jgi:hypothetical protein
MKELHAMAARFSPGDPRRGILFAKYRELAATIPQAREIVKGWVGDNFYRAAQALELADDDYSSFIDLYESEMQEGAEKPKTLPGRWAKGIVRREVLAHAREVYADQVDREVQHTMESNWRWRDAASIEEQTNQWYSEHWEGDSSSRPTIADVLGSHDAIYEMISEMSGGTRGVDNDFENRIQEEVQSRIDDIIDRVHRERVEAYEEESDGGDGPGSSGLLSETSAEAVFAGTGIHLSDYTYRHDGGEEVYEAILVQNGRAVGQVERHYDPHERTVYHAYFRLEERAQGGGVAYKMMDNSLHQYLDAGVREVTVSAGLDTGPYAWAKLGFDWKGSESREKAVEYVSSYLQKRGWTPVNAIAKAREVCVHPWTLADWHEPGLDEGSSYKLSTTTDMESVRRIQQSMKKKDDPDWWHTGKRVLLGVSTQLNSGQWAHNSKLYWKGIIRLRTPGDPSWERVKKLYKLGGDETKAA